MSVRVVQYLMWGIRIPDKKIGKNFYEKHEKFELSSPFSSEIKHHDNIMLLFDRYSGKDGVVGHVLEKGTEYDPFIPNDEPLYFSKLNDLITDELKEKVKDSVKQNFDLEGDFDFILITHYT